MCRPLHVSSRGPFTGGHIGPPLHNAGSVPEPTGNGVEQCPCGAGRARPYRCTTVGSSERADVDIGPSAAEAAWRSGGWLGPARRRGSGTPDRRALRGKVAGRDAPSWFPTLAPERIEIIFRRGVYVAKNTSQAASVENGRPNGAAILCAQSACAFIRPRQLCCLGRGNLSLKCSSVHFSDLKSP